MPFFSHALVGRYKQSLVPPSGMLRHPFVVYRGILLTRPRETFIQPEKVKFPRGRAR